MTPDLFSAMPNWCDAAHANFAMDRPDAEVILYPRLFSPIEARNFLAQLLREVSWKQEQIKVYGKIHDVPRLTAWYGEPNTTYIYSGIKVEASPWLPILAEIKNRIEHVSNMTFNSVLLNRYRDGSDSVAWHADDEVELGQNPAIGSVSFGAQRNFQMKHKTDRRQKQNILLENGSYLLMKGTTQHHWLHQIPKSKRAMGERINLTFRKVMLPISNHTFFNKTAAHKIPSPLASKNDLGCCPAV